MWKKFFGKIPRTKNSMSDPHDVDPSNAAADASYGDGGTGGAKSPAVKGMSSAIFSSSAVMGAEPLVAFKDISSRE